MADSDRNEFALAMYRQLWPNLHERQIWCDYQRIHKLAFPNKYRHYKRKWKATHTPTAYEKDAPRRRYWANRFNVLMYNQFYRLAFPELCTKRKQAWRKRNPEYRTEEARRYRQKYPEKARAIGSRYRATRKSARIGCPKEIVKIYQRANQLKKWFDVCVDHKIPIAKGGAHSADNLQIIYQSENAKKGMKLDYVPSVIFA